MFFVITNFHNVLYNVLFIYFLIKVALAQLTQLLRKHFPWCLKIKTWYFATYQGKGLPYI